MIIMPLWYYRHHPGFWILRKPWEDPVLTSLILKWVAWLNSLKIRSIDRNFDFLISLLTTVREISLANSFSIDRQRIDKRWHISTGSWISAINTRRKTSNIICYEINSSLRLTLNFHTLFAYYESIIIKNKKLRQGRGSKLQFPRYLSFIYLGD